VAAGADHQQVAALLLRLLVKARRPEGRPTVASTRAREALKNDLGARHRRRFEAILGGLPVVGVGVQPVS
jgi:hypothetical protein